MEDASAAIEQAVDSIAGSRQQSNERRAVVATSAAFFMIILDASIVNLALPSIGAELGSTLVGLQWIVDGYALVFASLLLSAGSLADRYGARRVFMTGLGIFTTASMLCSEAPTITALQSARILQGIGAALLLPTSLALLNHAIAEPKRRTQAISTWAGAGALGIALGPVAGGILVEALGWRSIFAVNLPIGLAGLWMTWRHLPESPRSAVRSLDAIGQSFAIAALVALTYALINAGRAGGSSAASLVGGCAFLVSTAGFLITESLVQHPMLPLGLFRRPAFSSTAAVGLLHNVGIYGMIFVLSIGFQGLHSADPFTAGLLFLPLTGGLAVGTRLGSRVLRSYGPHRLLIGGHLVAALGALALALLNVSVLGFVLAAPLMVIGLGAGTTTPAMSLSILDSVDRSQSGLASGLLNGARQSGGVIGVALLGAMLGEPATFAGVRSAFLAAAGALALAGIVAFSAWWRSRTDLRNADPSKVVDIPPPVER
jgi:DHA2 family methylenomycin A resistance protein-like MFS transporter